MKQVSDILQSATFWTAVGSVAAVLGVVVPLIQRPRRKKWLSRSERQRMSEQAREAASRFDYWFKNYIHPDGLSDKQSLINWLEADRGYVHVADNYQVFLKVAELLKEKGYDTQPAPTETEFISACKRALVGHPMWLSTLIEIKLWLTNRSVGCCSRPS